MKSAKIDLAPGELGFGGKREGGEKGGLVGWGFGVFKVGRIGQRENQTNLLFHLEIFTWFLREKSVQSPELEGC